MVQRNAPVGVFDSGHGGISVLRELVRRMPCEDFLYFGDSANAPYGPRTTESVQQLTFAAAERLLGAQCTALVVGWNRATAAAIDLLRQRYDQIPVVGIEPALKPAVLENDHPHVLVMATEMTLREEKFHRQMESYQDRAEIYRLPAPGIVESVEQGRVDGPELEAYLRDILRPYETVPITAVVLGCTHFPFVRGAIERCMGHPVTIYDGGPGTARETRRRLERADLLTDRTTPGRVELTNSRPEAVALSRRLLEL